MVDIVDDWTVEDAKVAAEILTELGYSQVESFEPGSDWKRDKLARIIGRHMDRLRAEVATLRHWTTVIAEACEENWTDWTDNGFNPADAVQFVRETGHIARQALAAAPDHIADASKKVPSDEYRSGIEDAAKVVERQAANIRSRPNYPGYGPQLEVSALQCAAKAIRALSEQAPSPWRPISEAEPYKDGRPVDLWCERYLGPSARRPNCRWGKMTNWMGQEFDGWIGLNGPTIKYEPTHFMLPPEPPQGGA